MKTLKFILKSLAASLAAGFVASIAYAIFLAVLNLYLSGHGNNLLEQGITIVNFTTDLANFSLVATGLTVISTTFFGYLFYQFRKDREEREQESQPV